MKKYVALVLFMAIISLFDGESQPLDHLGSTNSINDYCQLPVFLKQSATLTTSNLPVVVISSNPGETIRNEPKILADMKIIYNGDGQLNNVSDPGNIYSGKIGIEIRGRYSASLPQKPYGFETRDLLGNNLNTSILGMPSENDWALLANYNDKVFMRNFLAFEIFRKMGHYASRSRYCEVVINNEYQGIYLLCETIKRDRNRVNIAKLNPDENSGDDLTGGYIVKNDYYTDSDSWMSNYSPLNKPGAGVWFVYHDPKPVELTLNQKNYIKNFVNSLETTLYSSYFNYDGIGYNGYIDVPSFIDYFIISELSRDIDAYKKSRFYYKDKDSNGGLLFSGPVWDYDWAWKNINEDCIHFERTDGSGWAYKVNECNNWPVAPSWEIRLLEDRKFANKVNSRHFDLRKTILSEDYLFNKIDSVALLLDEAQQRHYQRWNILGINVGTPETDQQPQTFTGEIQKFKNWISTRLRWLDENMVGSITSYGSVSLDRTICRVFPNPVSEVLYIESDKEIKNISILNLAGILVAEFTDRNDFSVTLNLSNLSTGLYLTRIYFANGEFITRRIVKQ